jgi:hypothetical protein|nr:hypothetical protein [uncultured Pedobacter sp.]
MNFLSHYYFDKDKENPYEVFGMLLPDLLKNADKSWTIHPEKKEGIFNEQTAQTAILKGWKRHLAVDDFFHNSLFFKHHQHQIKLSLRKAITGSQVKPFFLGHISLELLLDNLLIANNFISISKLYHLLEQVDETEIKLFLQLNGIAEQDKFMRFFKGFVKDQYLYNYADEAKITYALKRICMRLWDNPFTPEQELAITERLVAYKKDLREDFIIIFDQIDAQIN